MLNLNFAERSEDKTKEDIREEEENRDEEEEEEEGGEDEDDDFQLSEESENEMETEMLDYI